MAIIEIRCFIAPVLDRCSELETAHYYFERIINTGKLLGLSNSDPILTNARTHLVHCLHKMQTVDGFQRAELMLNGEEGPLAVNQENMLNRLKRFHNRKEHDELLHCFNAVSSGLNSRELSIACELLGTSYIRNVVALCSGKYALSRSGVQQQLDEARHMLENSFALSIGDAMPRTTLIRSLHLVGLFALTVLPSLQYGGIPELAAQALICARAFSFGRTGVDEPSQACLEDCSILSDRVNKCVIERESIGSPLRQIEYLCGLKATLKPITDHGGPHISGWQLPFK
jgi:hypothetical protein